MHHNPDLARKMRCCDVFANPQQFGFGIALAAGPVMTVF
jgi:hypothetical protein